VPRGGAQHGRTAAASSTNLTAQTASGLSWSYLSVAVLLVATLAYTAVISRLLGPVAFGLMALANLVVLLTQFFARMGIASVLVQKPELSQDDIRAASTAGLALGGACCAVIWVFAPLISDLFNAPTLPNVLRAMAVSCIFTGWSMTGLGLLRRELRFRELSVIAVVTYVLGYLVVGIGLALAGAGVWSLVAASLVTAVAQAIWQYVLVRHPVRPMLRQAPYRAVASYGMRLSGAHLMDYIGGNLDTFTVARIAGTAVLGQYSRAYYLVFQPLVVYISQALTNVLFSSFSRIQEDSARLRRAYLSVFSLGCVGLFPLCVGMAVAAREIVLVVLGSQWGLAIGLVPWFALAGACHVASQMCQSLAEARADLNRSLAVQLVYIVALGALLVGTLAFRSRGVWVIAAAVAAAELLRYLGYLGLMRRILRLSAAQVAQLYAPSAFVSVAAALAIAGVQRSLSGRVPTFAVLAGEVAVGALAVGLCIRFGPMPSTRRELWQRLTAAGALGTAGGLRSRLAPLLIGPPAPVMTDTRQ
jgi:O-antigen/teichoic acid export membrane protein